MTQKSDYEFDLFISYASQDKAFVENELLPRLKTRGLKSFVDFIDFKPGKPELDEIKRGIKSSRKTLLLISPHYLKDNLSDFEKHLTRYMGVATKNTRCIPAIIVSCRLPDDLNYLVCIHLDYKNEQERNAEWDKLLKSLTENILYKPVHRKEKTPKIKSPLLSLPKMEKELRMNKAHWVAAGFSIPAEQFNFTVVYFENQIDIYRKIESETRSISDDLTKNKINPSQEEFLIRAYTTLDELDDRTEQVLEILETDQDHHLITTAYQAAKKLLENSDKTRQSIVSQSLIGALRPNELNISLIKLPVELRTLVISIEELIKHIKAIYKLAGLSLQNR